MVECKGKKKCENTAKGSSSKELRAPKLNYVARKTTAGQIRKRPAAAEIVDLSATKKRPNLQPKRRRETTMPEKETKKRKKRRKLSFWSKILSGLETLSVPIVTRSTTASYNAWMQSLHQDNEGRLVEPEVAALKVPSMLPPWHEGSDIATRNKTKIFAVPASLTSQQPDRRESSTSVETTVRHRSPHRLQGSKGWLFGPFATEERKLELKKQVLSHLYRGKDSGGFGCSVSSGTTRTSENGEPRPKDQDRQPSLQNMAKTSRGDTLQVLDDSGTSQKDEMVEVTRQPGGLGEERGCQNDANRTYHLDPKPYSVKNVLGERPPKSVPFSNDRKDNLASLHQKDSSSQSGVHVQHSQNAVPSAESVPGGFRSMCRISPALKSSGFSVRHCRRTGNAGEPDERKRVIDKREVSCLSNLGEAMKCLDSMENFFRLRQQNDGTAGGSNEFRMQYVPAKEEWRNTPGTWINQDVTAVRHYPRLGSGNLQEWVGFPSFRQNCGNVGEIPIQQIQNVYSGGNTDFGVSRNFQNGQACQRNEADDVRRRNSCIGVLQAQEPSQFGYPRTPYWQNINDPRKYWGNQKMSQAQAVGQPPSHQESGIAGMWQNGCNRVVKATSFGPSKMVIPRACMMNGIVRMKLARCIAV